MAKQFKSTDIANTAKNIIYNKFVLYFVFVIALLNLFFAAVKMDYAFCSIFVLVGFISAFFNKNMTVILVCTITISNIIRALIRGESSFEGMKEEIQKDLEDFSGDSSKDEVPSKKTPSSSVGSGEEEPTAKPSIASNSEKKQMVGKLKNEAQDLLEVQQKIIQGFEQIEPEMTRAENLINKINGTAKQIQAFQGMGN